MPAAAEDEERDWRYLESQWLSCTVDDYDEGTPLLLLSAVGSPNPPLPMTHINRNRFRDSTLVIWELSLP